MNGYYVYVLSSRRHRHLSVGVTGDLRFGVNNHRRRICRQLSKRRVYQKLVLVELIDNLNDAIGRERQLKQLPRRALERVISSANPDWEPLSVREYTVTLNNTI